MTWQCTNQRMFSPRTFDCVVHFFFCGLIICAIERASFAEENIWTVRKLNDNKPWDRFIDSPLAIRVEGRVDYSGGNQFRLIKCDAKFKVDKQDAAKLKNAPAKSNVEIRGRFKTKAEFIVEELKVVSSYLEQFDSKMSRLRRPTSEECNELGDWASERSRFYEDADLELKANEAYLKAFDIEYKTLKPADSEGRFLLAQKIDDRKLSKRRSLELIHEGLWIEWQAAKKTETPETKVWQQFSSKLAKQLPGTSDPLKSIDPTLREAYEQDPVLTYEKANDKTRHQLHRMLFVIVTRTTLLAKASPDGHDGNSIADEIDKLIPEEHAIAENQRLLCLSFRFEHIATATRDEVKNLAEAFRVRNRNDEAQQALQKWIKSHELRLKGDGVVGRLRLADEYLTLLNDEPTAVEHLKEAYTIDPGFEPVKLKLASLGYQFSNARWTKSAPMFQNMKTTLTNSSTEIRFGMTVTELRNVLGQPASLARAITARGITEVWSFGPQGSAGLIVRLEQKGRDSEAKVTAFSGQ